MENRFNLRENPKFAFAQCDLKPAVGMLSDNFIYLTVLLFCCIAIDLIKKLLTVDPKKRITVEEALQHPWISVSFSSFYSKFTLL